MSIVDKILDFYIEEEQAVRKDDMTVLLLAQDLIKNTSCSYQMKTKLSEIKKPVEIFDVALNSSNETCSINGKICKDRDIIYSKMKDYRVFFNNEIKFAIKSITRNRFISSSEIESFIDKPTGGWLSIKNIEYNPTDHSYTIYGQTEDEVYTFYRADDYFSDNLSLCWYISKNAGYNICHEYTETLQKYLPEGISITSKCPRLTTDGYYTHSYTELGDKIVDLSSRLVMDKDMYYKLMQPEELSRIKNSEMHLYESLAEKLLAPDPRREYLEDYFSLINLAAISQVCYENPEFYTGKSSVLNKK